MKITQVKKYFNKQEYRNLPVFIIEDAILPGIPSEVSSSMYDQTGNKGDPQVHLRHEIELSSAYEYHFQKLFTKIIDEINPQIKDMIPWNVWGSRTEYVKLTNRFTVLIDKPGFYMTPHIDNRNVGSVISLNLKDNPQGTGTRFYNTSEITKDSLKKFPTTELNEKARNEYDESCFMFEGPNKKGTGVLWWNHHNTYHGIRNNSQDSRHTIYSVTTMLDYMEDLRQKIEMDVVDRYNLQTSEDT